MPNTVKLSNYSTEVHGTRDKETITTFWILPTSISKILFTFHKVTGPLMSSEGLECIVEPRNLNYNHLKFLKELKGERTVKPQGEIHKWIDIERQSKETIRKWGKTSGKKSSLQKLLTHAMIKFWDAIQVWDHVIWLSQPKDQSQTLDLDMA